MASPDLTDAQRRAFVRALLDHYRAVNPLGETAGVLWRVCNVLWRDGDPLLPEPLARGRRDPA